MGRRNVDFATTDLFGKAHLFVFDADQIVDDVLDLDPAQESRAAPHSRAPFGFPQFRRGIAKETADVRIRQGPRRLVAAHAVGECSFYFSNGLERGN